MKALMTEEEGKKITGADILNLLKERREIRKNNKQITASICRIYRQRQMDKIKGIVIETGNEMIEQAKIYGNNAETMAKTILKNYKDRKENKQNILAKYQESLQAIENEYIERQKFILEHKEKFEKLEEYSVQKELELREKRDEIRESPEYAEHLMKEEKWLKEALEENNLETLQEKRRKYEELKEQNPLTEYDEKIKQEKERRQDITYLIEMYDKGLIRAQKEKEESIKEARKNKKNQIAEAKTNTFQKVMRGLFHKINGTKKFAKNVIEQLEEKVYDINNELLPAIREKISDGIDKCIDEIKEKGEQLEEKVYDINNKTLPAFREKVSDGIDKCIDGIKEKGKQLEENMLGVAGNKLAQSIEKEKQVNVQRTGKYDVLMKKEEEQR